VQKLRIERKMTLEDMQSHDFSPQHFQKIEAGKKAVGLYTAYRIAKAFHISLFDLLKSVE